MNDEPIAKRADGTPIYDNTPTVVIVLATVGGSLLAIRRNNDPGKGLIGLPGGYHMRGETWQEAALRELVEETGYVGKVENVAQMASTVTDEYGNNLIFAQVYDVQAPAEPHKEPIEVQEVLLLEATGPKAGWAFPRHFNAAADYIPFEKVGA